MSNSDTTTFDVWWYNIGSGVIPEPGDDHETHVHRVARLAWDAAIHRASYPTLLDVLKDQ
jgi:hypothetical protein